MRRIALLGLLLFVAVPPSALASTVLSPPGHDGANQYSEVIPTSAGNAAPPGSVRGSGNANGSPSALAGLGQGRGTDARLATMGKDGQAAAALAAATAPAPASGAAVGSANSPGVTGGSAKHSGAQATPNPAGGSAVSGIASALSGSDGGGLGLLLPLLLATVLVAVVGLTGLGLRRSARHRQPGV